MPLPIPRKIAFHTLGCKLNFSESSAIAEQFSREGYTIEEFENKADIYVINTCSVTDHADRKTKYVVKKALERNPLAQIAVIGCYAQLKPKEIAAIPGVNLVLGAKEKFNLLSHIQALDYGCEPAIFNTHIKEAQQFHPAWSVGSRTRSFLKVQDGCNYFCSFCTIPLARGASRSSSISEIVKAAQENGRQGIREIVLTGVNIGDFRNDKKENFLDLIQCLDKVEGIDRFRISSIEPNLLTNETIEFVAQSQKFVPHFHIPLQSGSNKILTKMRRRYQKELYAARLEKIKSLMPHCGLGADVIVGFPGEEEEDFLQTYQFLKLLPVSYLHVFPYSERPHTTAVRMAGRIPNTVRTKRHKILTQLSEEKKSAFYIENKGRPLTVLWENERHGQQMHGYTENYISLSRSFDVEKVNTLETLRIE